MQPNKGQGSKNQKAAKDMKKPSNPSFRPSDSQGSSYSNPADKRQGQGQNQGQGQQSRGDCSFRDGFKR